MNFFFLILMFLTHLCHAVSQADALSLLEK